MGRFSSESLPISIAPLEGQNSLGLGYSSHPRVRILTREETPSKFGAACRVDCVRVVDDLEAPAQTRGWRVLVVDDDPFARRAISQALRSAGLAVVAQAASGIQAVELARDHRPDVVLIDVDVPAMDGITATRRIVEDRPDQLVVLLAGADDDELALQGLRVGAVGYLSKEVGVDAVTRAVVGVLRGEAAVSRELTRRVLDKLHGMPGAGAGFRPVLSPLTRREWEVLDLMCAGSTTEEIALRLVVSEQTVHSHTKRILRKLAVNSREQAVATVWRMRGAQP